MVDLKVLIDSIDANAWKTITITHSLEQAAITFSMAYEPKFDPRRNERFPFREYQQVEIFADGDPILIGYLNTPTLEYGPTMYRAALSGASRTQQIVDSSAILEKGEVSGVTVMDFAKLLLDGHRITPVLQNPAGPGKKFKKIKIEDGETVYSAISKAAEERGMMTWTVTGQELMIGTPKKGATEGILELEVPGQPSRTVGRAITGSVSGNASGRFSTYIAKGSVAGDVPTGDRGRRVITINDPSVPINRTLVIRPTVSHGGLREAARQDINRRAGRSKVVVYDFRSWRTIGGDLWRPEQYLTVHDERLGVSEDLMVSTVVRTIVRGEGGGEQCKVELKPRSSYIGADDPPEMAAIKQGQTDRTKVEVEIKPLG